MKKNAHTFSATLLCEVCPDNRGANEPRSRDSDRAREIVPRLTGTLALSIRPTASQKEGAVLAGSRSVPYAGPIHFGWPSRNIEPDPFLYDALGDRRDQVIEVYEARVEALVRKLDRETP